MTVVAGPLAYFQEQLREGRFMIQRSRRSGEYVFYPRVVEPGTGSDDLEWVSASGRGKVYAYTTVYPRKRPPYNVAIVQLDEGPKLMSRIVGVEPNDISIGMTVHAVIEACASPENDVTLAPTLLFSAKPQEVSSLVAQ